jgi:hypothetical protein
MHKVLLLKFQSQFSHVCLFIIYVYLCMILAANYLTPLIQTKPQQNISFTPPSPYFRTSLVKKTPRSIKNGSLLKLKAKRSETVFPSPYLANRPSPFLTAAFFIFPVVRSPLAPSASAISPHE